MSRSIIWIQLQHYYSILIRSLNCKISWLLLRWYVTAGHVVYLEWTVKAKRIVHCSVDTNIYKDKLQIRRSSQVNELSRHSSTLNWEICTNFASDGKVHFLVHVRDSSKVQFSKCLVCNAQCITLQCDVRCEMSEQEYKVQQGSSWKGRTLLWTRDRITLCAVQCECVCQK